MEKDNEIYRENIRNLFTSNYIPTLRYIWHLHSLICMFDIYIRRWYLTLQLIIGVSDIHIWHVCLTFMSDTYNIPCVLTWIQTNPTTLLLIYTWIAKPLILPLQMFVSITNNTTCSQNSRNNRRTWGILAAPVVACSERNHKDFLCKFKTVLIYTWIA